MPSPGYIRLIDFLARIFKYMATAICIVFTVLLVYSIVSDWDKIVSIKDASTMLNTLIVNYIVPRMGLLIAAIVLGGAAAILSMEARRAKIALTSRIYGELALYGSVDLNTLLSRYGFEDISELQEFFDTIENEMRAKVVIDPSTGEARLEYT